MVERIRTLRVLRLMTAMQLKRSELEPWQRNDGVDADLEEYRTSTPLARALPTNDGLFTFHDANIVLSRAFEQVAALRIWQLEHDGHYPETLEALVPGLLPRLPLDPYSGQPFRYRRSGGQMLLPLGLSGLARPSRTKPHDPSQAGPGSGSFTVSARTEPMRRRWPIMLDKGAGRSHLSVASVVGSAPRAPSHGGTW